MSKKKQPQWVTRDLSESTYTTIRCNFHTRLAIPGDSTPSGQGYEFEPGEVKEVSQQDKAYLLSLVHNQSSCCGGSTPQPISYFTEV